MFSSIYYPIPLGRTDLKLPTETCNLLTEFPSSELLSSDDCNLFEEPCIKPIAVPLGVCSSLLILDLLDLDLYESWGRFSIFKCC